MTADALEWDVPDICVTRTVITGVNLPALSSLIVVAVCTPPVPPIIIGGFATVSVCGGFVCNRRAGLRWYLWCGGIRRSYSFGITFRRSRYACCRRRIVVYSRRSRSRVRGISAPYATRVAIRPAPRPCNRCWTIVNRIWTCGRGWRPSVVWGSRIASWGFYMRGLRVSGVSVARCCGRLSRAGRVRF